VNFIRHYPTGFFVAALLLGSVSAAAVELFWENAYGGVARLGMLMGYGLVVLLLPVRIFIWQAGKRFAEPFKSLAWQVLSDEQFRNAGWLARATFAVQHVGVFCVAFVLGWTLVVMAVIAMRFLQA
jgi:ABC-type sulfate transport system permease component